MSISRKEYQLLLKIGANLSNDFNTSFKGACERLKELAKETAETSKGLKDVSGFQKAKAALEENKKKLAEQKEHYGTLKTSIANQKEVIKQTTEAISANQQMLKNYSKGSYGYNEITAEIERLKETQVDATEAVKKFSDSLAENEKQQKKTSSAVEDNQEEVYKYSSKLSEAGINVNNLTEEQKELQEQYDQLKTARDNLQKIGVQYDELTEKARSQAIEVGKLAAVYAAVGAGFYKGAINPAIEFESAYAGVLKTVDGTPEQLQQIKEDILNLSTTVPTAASDIATVAEAAGQLGIATENITEFSKVMIDLGESTNLSSDEAASELAKFANITKMDPSNYSNLGSVIVDLGNNFATTEADIVSMATRLASTGTITGLSEAQIMAVATALSSVGIEAEAGGSAVSKLLKQFETMYWNDDESLGLDERKLNDYAKVAGVTIDEFKEIYGRDSLEAVSMFISGLNDVERNSKNAVQILSELDITETRMSNAVLSLASSDGILTNAVETANTAWEENTALAAEAGKRYETTESQLQMAKNSINNAGIALGEVFTPMIAEAANGVNEFAQDVAGWVKDNPEAVKHTVILAAKLGGLLITAKGLKLAFTGVQTVGKGLQKVFSMGSGSAFAASAALSALAIAGMAAYEWLQADHEAALKAAKAIGDLRLYGNGAETSIVDLTEAIKESSSESYKMAQEVNNSAKEYEGVKDNIAEVRRELEFYDQAIDGGALNKEEVDNLKQSFENLAEYLEQDFSGAYDRVFKNFKDAIGILGKEAGIATSEVTKLLNSFKTDYNQKVSDVNDRISTYLDKSLTDEGTSSADDEQFAKDAQLMYELSRNHSTALNDYTAFAEGLGDIDFVDEETAQNTLNELIDYANAYIEELNSAQEQINKDISMMSADALSMYNSGEYSDEEYKSYMDALEKAGNAIKLSYDNELANFGETLNETASGLYKQLTSAEIDMFNELRNNPDLWSRLSNGLEGIGKSISNGQFGVEDFRVNMYAEIDYDAFSNAQDAYKDVRELIDNLQKIADSQTVKISSEVEEPQSVSGHLTITPLPGPVIIPWNGEKNARGTDYSADTFLAGEHGAEIVTNARGYKVYTAEETKDIFDTYAQITSYFPKLAAAQNNGGGYTGIEAARGEILSFAPQGEKGVKCEINYNPTILIDGGNTEELEEKLKQNNENLLKLFKNHMREEAENERRMSYA